MKKLNKKSKIFILGCIISIFSVSFQEVNAAENSMILLSAENKTCNVYTKASKSSEKITYINPLYQRDGALLAESGNFYKIKLAGVTGWIAKDECYNTSKGANIIPISKIGLFSYGGSLAGSSLTGLDVSRYHALNNKLYYNGLANSYGSNMLGYTYEYGYTDLPIGLKNNTVYYSYDGIYYYTNYNTMINDYKSNVFTNAANRSNPYFDYYQYLPLKTKSNATSVAYDKYLLSRNSDAGVKLSKTITSTFNVDCKGTLKTLSYSGYTSNVYGKGSAFINSQNTNNVNAGILYGITLNESAFGESNLARFYNNPFGWGAVDSCPSSAIIYSSIDNGIDQYFKNMYSTYSNPIHSIGGKGTHLGNKQAGTGVSYASDPNWGYKNAFNYRRIDEYAGNVDKNKYKIGVLHSGSNAVDSVLKNEAVYAYTDTAKSRYTYYYERNYSTVIITGESGNFYKVKNDSGNNLSDLYIEKSKVIAIAGSGATTIAPPSSPTVTNEKIIYNANGTIYRKDIFDAKGLMIYRYYYHTDKQISLKIWLKADGVSRQRADYYNTSGQLTERRYYHDNGKISLRIWYHSNGQRRRADYFNTIGQITERKYYYDNGKISLRIYYATNGYRTKAYNYTTSGVKTQYRSYHTTGKIKENIYYKADGYRSVAYYYNSSGVITEKRVYGNANKWKQVVYYVNGKAVRTVNY